MVSTDQPNEKYARDPNKKTYLKSNKGKPTIYTFDSDLVYRMQLMVIKG